MISWFGTHAIIWGVALTLMTMGLLLILLNRTAWLLISLVAVMAGSLFVFNQGWLRGPCLRESNYFCIKVKEQEKDGAMVRVLILDRLVHSYTALDDPAKLVYGYEQMYAEAAAYQARQKDQLKALFIGGGGYTFPRYLETLYPAAAIAVIEIDPAVTETAHDFLGLSRQTRIETFNQDARLFLAEEPVRQYDLIMGDAFNDFSVPYHLTTKEFNDRVRVWLAQDGLYVVNLIDGGRADFLRAYTHTLSQTFAYVYLAPTNRAWRASPRTTFVLIAADTPLDMSALADIDALLVHRLFSEAEVETLLSEDDPIILTDRYAPVDQLLAPVTRGETLAE